MPFHHFKTEEGFEYGSFEVFYRHPDDLEVESDGDGPLPAGWYWWACLPGCMPDGDPMGPFATEQEAIDAAQSDA